MACHLIFIGAPGSGKGTQANFLVKSRNYSHVSTGDLLRGEISRGTSLGNEVKNVMDQGQLVSDDLVLRLLESNLDLKSKKYIFDGYPRNLAQAISLEERILKGNEYKAVYFEMDVNGLILRLTNRRMCSDCGAIYNLLTQPMSVDGVCDKCGGHKILHRDDDKEDVIKSRMEVFSNSIQPVIDFYHDRGVLKVISAENEIDVIKEKIIELLNN